MRRERAFNVRKAFIYHAERAEAKRALFAPLKFTIVRVVLPE
jgi:hypothetical protein